jgi:hypothetical protein
MSPATVTLQVPYADNEQQFLVRAVEVAVRTYRRLNANPGDDLGKLSATSSTQAAISSSEPE